ncbi:TonB-dependent receptor [Hymenobacter busanensis]|uniref:TonB-dependent receptor n=1 Tax=Hymenobacter busanensis TaxID=2607656 RepID=A0A7L5A254_9BACT|nr:TonB-dependent receptor [Hymenobacter busanensis]KAA9331359.1 TonB-dependent receptor [Hymenobacter busanensis]QHJ08512.1 TonB-dependent receptor plug domain-containing protein [Hymenobacter busanensis]
MQKPLLYPLLAGVLACSTPAWAQQSAAGIGGVVRNEAGEPVPGATVFIKGTLIGTGTNREGQFTLPADFSRGPLVISISFLGYESRELELSKPTPDIVVTLNEAVTLNEVVVAASRVEESLQEAPVTIEKVGAQQIMRTPPPDVLAGLNQLKGIDVNSTSMVMSSLSTRGFNSPKSERVIQLVDYFDTQSPSLNINSGNLTGIPELDIASIEVIHGPASALYGANAFNGVVLLNSKDPFVTEGFSARVRGGERSYFDGQFRYAQKLGNKFAFKITGSYLTATDWLPENYDATSTRLVPTNNAVGSVQGYDAVNRYGDVANTFKANQPFPGGVSGELVDKTVFMPGFTEKTLVGNDDKAQAFKVVPTISYLLTDKIKATVAASINRGTGSYQSSSRYRLRDFGTNQYRGELKGERWFLRGSSTQDFGNDSYDLGFLGGFIQNSPVAEGTTTTYATQYFATYNGTYKKARAPISAGGFGQTPEQALVTAKQAADATQLDPASARFGDLRTSIINDTRPGLGARLNPSSLLNEGNAQYNFRLGEKSDLIVGGAYRKFRLGSNGQFFSDDNERIQNHELGAYGQLTHQMLDDRLKLALAARIDEFKNFDPAVSPRASVVYSAGDNKQHSFRASFGRAFRSPTQLDQYVRLDVGQVLLLGNVGNGFQGYTLPTSTSPSAAIDLAPLDLERVNTYEVGYRGNLANKLYVDVNYFRSYYNDFIGARRFIGNTDGSRPSDAQLQAAGPLYQNKALPTRVLQVWYNQQQEVRTQGTALGLSYNIAKPLTLTGNYSLNVLDRSNIKDAGFQTFFNTPKHKYNVGANGTTGNLSYSANYRWAQGHLYETPFAVGQLDDYSSLDLFVGYTLTKLATTVQAGASNVLDNNNVQIYGGPQIGRLAYVGLLVDIK